MNGGPMEAKRKARVRFPPTASLDSRDGSDYAQSISVPGVYKWARVGGKG